MVPPPHLYYLPLHPLKFFKAFITPYVLITNTPGAVEGCQRHLALPKASFQTRCPPPQRCRPPRPLTTAFLPAAVECQLWSVFGAKTMMTSSSFVVAAVLECFARQQHRLRFEENSVALVLNLG